MISGKWMPNDTRILIIHKTCITLTHDPWPLNGHGMVPGPPSDAQTVICQRTGILAVFACFPNQSFTGLNENKALTENDKGDRAASRRGALPLLPIPVVDPKTFKSMMSMLRQSQTALPPHVRSTCETGGFVPRPPPCISIESKPISTRER